MTLMQEEGGRGRVFVYGEDNVLVNVEQINAFPSSSG